MLLMPNDKYNCEWDEHRWSRSGFCLDCGEEGEEPDRDDPIDDYRQDLADWYAHNMPYYTSEEE